MIILIKHIDFVNIEFLIIIKSQHIEHFLDDSEQKKMS